MIKKVSQCLQHSIVSTISTASKGGPRIHLSTEHYSRCIRTLEASLSRLEQAEPESIEYEIFRNAVIKGFELILESTVKLLRIALRTYTGRPRDVDVLTYKDVLRHAARHHLMTTSEVERWFVYRDNRDDTANDYGEGFAEDTLKLMPQVLSDAQRLESVLRERFGNAET